MGLQTGPCVNCGALNYSLSFGGPSICPACDTGSMGIGQPARGFREALDEISSLRSRAKELEAENATLKNESVGSNLYVQEQYKAYEEKLSDLKIKNAALEKDWLKKDGELSSKASECERLREALNLFDVFSSHHAECDECGDEGCCEKSEDLWDEAEAAMKKALSASEKTTGPGRLNDL